MDSKAFIGIMSGTSVDSVDVAVVKFADSTHSTNILGTHEEPFPAHLRDSLQNLIARPQGISLDELGSIDRQLGLLYARAANNAMAGLNLAPGDIAAIGCHGQTIRHQPDSSPAYTMQIGDGATIAVATGVATVNDFRSADIALGGQGAPLACAFHEWAFAADKVTAVVNLGGIANITVIAPGETTLGYDTGPANTLLDQWCAEHRKQPFDENGEWARSGAIDAPLLQAMLADAYFAQPAPKSTGREYFHRDWLDSLLAGRSITPADVQATLAELTARSVAAAARDAGAQSIRLCGGGACNSYLVERISLAAGGIEVMTTTTAGVPPEWVEACAFAWLARARCAGASVGMPAVTGAARSGCLGALHLPPGA